METINELNEVKISCSSLIEVGENKMKNDYQ